MFFCFFFCFFFAAILDFTDVKNVTEGRGPGSVFYVVDCNRVQWSVSIVSRCPGSPISETHRPFFLFFESCSHVKTTLREDNFR